MTARSEQRWSEDALREFQFRADRWKRGVIQTDVVAAPTCRATVPTVQSTSGGVESRHATRTRDDGHAGTVALKSMDGALGNGFGFPATAVHASSAGVAPGPLTPSAPDQRHRKAASDPSLIADRSGASSNFARLCVASGLPAPRSEYRFHYGRRWRFDYAWPAHMLALEIEGGIWTQGRHTRGSGALADLEKYSEGAILGWRVIYCTPSDLQTVGMDRVRRALKLLPEAA